MKALMLALGVVAAVVIALSQPATSRDAPGATAPTTDAISQAYETRRSGVPVTGTGIVAKVLPDDNEGSRHQRFLLKLDNGRTLLVAHNIDLAPRIPALKSGDSVAFHGIYEWNAKGGTVHWTHHDPSGRHATGWLRHAGSTYQ